MGDVISMPGEESECTPVGGQKSGRDRSLTIHGMFLERAANSDKQHGAWERKRHGKQRRNVRFAPVRLSSVTL